MSNKNKPKVNITVNGKKQKNTNNAEIHQITHRLILNPIDTIGNIKQEIHIIGK